MELKRLIESQVPDGYRKDEARNMIAQLDPSKALERETEMAKVWADQERSSPAPEVYEKSLAAQWQKTVGAADGAPYVLRALLRRLEIPSHSPFAEDSPEVPKLAAAFLKPDCAGARGLSEAEIAKLKALAAKAPPPAPKQ